VKRAPTTTSTAAAPAGADIDELKARAVDTKEDLKARAADTKETIKARLQVRLCSFLSFLL
jgi:hypothetical protein